MPALIQLTLANIRSYVRDRAALFWTIAFPLIFILLFGGIFSGGGAAVRDYGWVDLDASAGSAELRAAFAGATNVELHDATEDEALAAMREGDTDGVFVVPSGYGDALARASGGEAAAPPARLIVYTDPTQQASRGTTYQLVGAVLGQVNLAASGRGPVLVPDDQAIQTQDLTFISYLVPSILGMALMQLGIFAAIPLVADRQKLILKRLSATPLRRWQLVGSNVVMRLIIAVFQTIVIVGVGVLAFDVQLAGNLLLIAGFVLLGSLAFIALGYVIASFASTEDAANGMTSVVQFPMMFLSGTFFPIAAMPEPLQGVARLIPLTYLSDALRQIMVGGAAFSPLWLCAAVLVGWLVGCFAIAARAFRWQ